MTDPNKDNVLIVHWHDLGRYLGVYGHPDVDSPRLDQLAAEGILFTRAHATAPLCSPSRGSLFTGRYPQNNGLVGLAHHGWEYRADVRTLPQILSENGWHTALFGMQHETSYPARLGFDEYDVSNSFCEYVVERSVEWLANPPSAPFLLTAGFFETHRPYPADRYQPADRTTVAVPDYLPETEEVRQDLAGFYGSITVADAAVGQLLDALAATGLDQSTWVVFVTDHGPALPRAKSTLYDAGTGIAVIVRPPLRAGRSPHVYDDLFSGVDLVPTLLELLGVQGPAEVDGISHAAALRTATPTTARRHGRRSTRRRRITIPSTRSGRSGRRNTATSRTTRPGHCWTCRGTSPTAHRAWRSRHSIGGPRPERELYDLLDDPTESRNLLGPDATDKAEAIVERARVAAERLAAEDQRRHSVGVRGHANLGALHRDLSNASTVVASDQPDRAIAAERGIEDEHS